MAIRTDLMESVMEFRYGQRGWSERQWLTANSYAAALSSLNVLMNQRLAILPDNAMITYARVSFVGRPRERRVPVVNFPLMGKAHTAHAGPPAYVPVAADPNDVEAALFVQFSTDSGRWANYYYRCLPDDVIAAGAITTPIVVPGANPTPNEATWFERFGNWVSLLMGTIAYASFRAAAVPPAGPSYEVQAFTDAAIRGIANRKTGLPFGSPHGRRKAS